ncbi:MAG TPA: hypothetical protein VNI54_10195 [Thermoanaerobaculia bacterium]|nr:hypothetical protein [Thermoanaerobaculia bacterium]
MKRLSTLTLVVSLFAATAALALDGAWTASIDEKHPDRVYLNLTQGKFNNMGSTFALSGLSGLTSAQIHAATMTPVHFAMRREAGTVDFEGTFRNGKGAGQFTFAADRTYIDKIKSLGLAFDLEKRHRRKERTNEDDLFALALHDVSTAFIKSMMAEGYRVSLEKYLAMRIFNITPEYIREMRSLGFKDIDDDELVASKIHKVTPQFVREMRAAGWDLSLDEYQGAAIHGATPKFAEEMRRLGYGNLSHDDLVSFRIHRVTAEFIEELRKLGYAKVSADDLVAMRIHRVTPEFIRELATAGYENVPPQKLVEMRIHKIDAQYLKKMR